MTDPPGGMGAGGASADDDAIAPLLAGQLDALFWRPTRLGVDSAWYGHLPFAHWVVAVSRPRLLVELGTHAGVSYSAFCEAVQRTRLDTSCLAVDTWQGDEHAGFYGEDIFRDLQAFHDARYAGFSRLLRSDFDGALDYVGDGSVDLLHIDGRHTYEDVRHDYESWRPKLSDRAVVLFHDINVRERGFGVWRLWAELSPGFAHFAFLHAYGLGVLCVGDNAPAPVRALCELADPAAVAQLRERFSLLGERWVLEHQQRRLNEMVQTDLVTKQEHVATLEAKFAEMAAYATSLERAVGQPPARAELRGAMARAVTADHERRIAEGRATEAERRAATAEAEVDAVRAAAGREIDTAWGETSAMRREMDAIARSRTWRAAQRLRTASDLVRRSVRHPLGALAGYSAAAGPPVSRFAEEPAVGTATMAFTDPVMAEASAIQRPRVLFAAGEPDTPGCLYRCVRNAEAAVSAGWDARWKPIDAVDAGDLRDTDLVVLWRVTWSTHVEGVIEHVRLFGGRVALDLDDLMIRLDLARVEYIDAIRSINWSEAHVRGMFSSVLSVLHNVDCCIATTDELAAELRRHQKASYVLVNGFDAVSLRRSRLAARARVAAPADPVLRIGYAGGSRTHQRDFAAAADAIAAVLQARPHTRLVLFRHGAEQEGLIAADEFPALAALGDRIEWRELVPLEALPDELARFDINIVPLQLGNPFVEAKSELKYFEAAIAGVPTVASPTGPYARAIRHGETGLLAADAAGWEQALLMLVDDTALRDRMARTAAAEVLWRFGPEGRAHAMRHFLAQHRGGARPADGDAMAGSFARALAEARAPRRSVAPVQPTETLFAQDRMGEAAVTVVIASYNYAEFIQQALESVRLQSLQLLDLVVVDDASPDPATVEQILDWAHTHAGRFNRLLVLRHLANAGLGATRNTGFMWAETAYVLPLDADNRLRPDCAEQLLAVLDGSGAAYAFPCLQHFGADDRVTGGKRYEPQHLVGGNYIDAMALVARWAWSAAGGYYVQRDAMGWEDFSLWCRMAELGFWGRAVEGVLAEYRVHADSMVNAITETADNKRAMLAFIEARHPWLQILSRQPQARA